MFSEQKIRAVLFHLSVLIFIIGLPFILSFTLGYKFDSRTLKFTKAGIIALKTQPAGASMYLNGLILNEKTPATIGELLPGEYNVRIELADYYPWEEDVAVYAGQVTRLEKIILFPLRPDIKKLNKERLSSFWIDKDNRIVYYLNQDDSYIYTSDLEGDDFEDLVPYASLTPPPARFVLSQDKLKLLYFNRHQIGIAYLAIKPENLNGRQHFVIDYPRDDIVDVFWHSDSFHIILVSSRKIQVLEAKPGSEAIDLVVLNKKNSSVSYDINSDTLYFTDYQKADDGNFYNNLYKLELNAKILPLQELLKIKPGEKQPQN